MNTLKRICLWLVYQNTTSYENVNFKLNIKYVMSSGNEVEGRKFYEFTKLTREKWYYSSSNEMSKEQKEEVDFELKEEYTHVKKCSKIKVGSKYIDPKHITAVGYSPCFTREPLSFKEWLEMKGK